jgi:antitoxin component YwqK of YwqJK toxin-antitoxin module
MSLKLHNILLFCLIAGATAAQTTSAYSVEPAITENGMVPMEVTTIDPRTENKNSPDQLSIPNSLNAHQDTEEVIDNGKVIAYYENGAVRSIDQYKRGKLHGKQTQFYPDGTIKNVAHYKKGVLHGDTISYFPNGTTEYVEHYKKGLIEGDRYAYHDNGQVSIHCTYEKAVLVGFWESYAADGAVESYGYYEGDDKIIIYSIFE